MRKETNLTRIKEMAKTFLYMDYELTPMGKILLIHPVFDSCMQPYNNNGKTELVDIVDDEEGYIKVLEYYVDVIDQCDSLDSVLFVIRSPYQLTFFRYIKEYLSLKDYSRLLADIWVTSENPNMDANVTVAMSARFFRKADKNYMMNNEELDYYNSLPDVITVYRGVANGRVENGLSWTENKEKAIWFAGRFSTKKQHGYLLKGTAHKDKILAYFNRRNEDELVIYPKDIMDIERIDIDSKIS